MEYPSAIIMIAFLLIRQSWTDASSKSETFYVLVTGKSKAQLLDSGGYVLRSAFGSGNISNSTWVASGIETKAGDTRRYLPMTSAVRAGHDANSIKFYLFTASNPIVGKHISEAKPDSFFSSNWGLNQPLKVIVHDYRGDCDRDVFATQMISAYMSTKKIINLVCMNWQQLASEESYYDSVENTRMAGKKLADFLSFIKRSGYIRTFNDVHIIGFGIGAHLGGVTGFQIREMNELGDMIGRITGLDPSGPGFSNVGAENRLDPTDARFVDIIHSNMGSVSRGYLGMPNLAGHADYFPNGGSFQPNCGSSIVGDVISTCSHLEAVLLYAKSIRGSKFIGCKCSDWISFLRDECGDCRKGPLMGEMASKSRALGSFFLRT